MFELNERTGKVVLESRMYVKLSYDLKKSCSLCKGPGGTSFSACRRMAAARRAEMREGEDNVRGSAKKESSQAMVGGDRSNSLFN